MEEEINYATVVFKDGAAPPKEEKTEPTEPVYSEVKPKEPAATTTKEKLKNVGAVTHCHAGVMVICLAILCVLLVGTVSAIIYITTVAMKQQKNQIYDLLAENEVLTWEKFVLEREKEELSKVAENFNRTLRIIQQFDTFPVNEYCSENKCQPCLNDWIQYEENCYLFYNKGAPWKTWEKSRKFCRKTKNADLVVIDNLQEQEFISNNTQFYYDKHHGYWLGLYKTDNNWLWVDGRNDTLGYWIEKALGSDRPYALMIPDRNLTASWMRADNVFQNKFICETEALIWPN